MKFVYYLSCIFFASTFINTAQAYNNSLSTNLIDYITKTKPIVKPESQDFKLLTLTLSSKKLILSLSPERLEIAKSGDDGAKRYIKLASVSFIGDSGIQATPSPETSNCSKTEYPYQYEMALSNCATASRCGKGYTMRFKCTSCKNNMTLGSDGRCKCNKSAYPYDMYDNPCTYAYDESSMCKEMGTDGVLRMNYSACKCPDNWKECNKDGEVGFGGACVSGGKSYYSGCTCKSPYSYLCNGVGQNYNEAPSGNYCANTVTGMRYYKTCAEVCWSGYYKSAQDFWAICGKSQCQYEQTQPQDPCSAYPHTNTSLPQNCAAAGSCTSQGVTYYASTCTTCRDGYELVNGACKVDLCSNFPHTNTSLPQNCAVAESCTNGGNIYYASTCTTCNDGYSLKNGVCKQNSLSFVVTSTKANQSISGLTILGTASIDWGDGTIESSSGNYVNNMHTYTSAGSYTITITGSPTQIQGSMPSGSDIYVSQLIDINLPGVQRYYDLFEGQSLMTGDLSTMTFPSSLTHAGGMFRNCSSLTGNVPTLPSSLTNGYSMFSGCSGLTGFGFTAFPSSLTDARSMFYGCTGLTGNVPTLPSSLTQASNMFYGCTGLTGFGFKAFPNSLSDGENMFSSCSSLTGKVPTLPSGLTNGKNMFYGCSGLTGFNFTAFPSNLSNGYNMFRGCSQISGKVPTLPSNLTEGRYMFYGCTPLYGKCPDKPASLTSYSYMYTNTSVTCSYGKP